MQTAANNKANILIVGCGDLGGKVAQLLSASGHQVTALSRTVKTLDNVTLITADVTKPQSLTVIKSLTPSIIIYCVSADGRTDAQYKAQYVDGLRNVLSAQSNNKQLTTAFFVSSTRVYGQTSDQLLDSEVIAKPADFGGERMLEAEQVLASMPYQTSSLRLSGIYGPGRLRMINLAKDPTRWPEGNGWTNRIHRDDAANFIQHLVDMATDHAVLAPHYIVTDSKPSTQYAVLHWLSEQLGISFSARVPAVSGGKRLSNDAMLATGFQLTYPDYQSGYTALIK
jgi:nucleoside-diphosphate-sugar epimerase